MLHEILPHRYDNAYRPEVAGSHNRVLCYCRDAILLGDGEEISLPQRKVFPTEAEDSAFEFAFSIDEEAYFLHAVLEEIELPGFRWVQVRDLRHNKPFHLAYSAMTGHHLYRWYQSRQFCGACGTRTLRDKVERMLYCESCGQKEYPVIMPAVIVGIIRGNSLLMTKYADRPSPNWALVAGFTEIGETFEETVAREAFEETGLRVKNITYYKSQPWPFSGSLLAGYFCEAQDDADIRRNEHELAEAVFVPREAIDVRFDGRALTNEMICCFRDKGADAVLQQDPLRQKPYPGS